MTKRKIFLLSLIAVLAVTYVFQLIFFSRGKIQEISVKDEIASVKIEKGDTILNLTKNEDNYFIDEKLPAKAEAAGYIFENISSIKIIDTITKNPSENDFERYGLVSPVKVTAVASDNKTLRSITVGKTSSTGNQTYVQLDGKKEIYLVSGNFNSTFSASKDNLLDYILYKVNADEVYKIQVTYSTFGTFTAEKAGESANFKWSITQTDNDVETEKFNSDKFADWVSSVTELKAEKWMTDFNPSDSSLDNSRYFSIIISAAGKDIHVDLYQIKADAGSEKLCICSENEFLCTIAAEDVHRLVPELETFIDE